MTTSRSKPAEPAQDPAPASSPSNLPTHDVYVVQGEGKEALWTKVGGAWPHHDNDGFNIQLNALPVGVCGRNPAIDPGKPHGTLECRLHR